VSGWGWSFGYLGGMLALEWAASAPEMVDALCVVGCCGRHPDWAIGFGEAGRQAIFADAGWEGGYYALRGGAPPLSGMAAARQLAMLSYRTPQSLSEKFGRALVPGGRPRELAAAQGGGGAPFFDVEGYLNYQGEKFRKRFDPLSYVRLTQLLDSHDLGRGRAAAGGDYRAVLASLRQRTLVVGIDSDLLYPVRVRGCLRARSEAPPPLTHATPPPLLSPSASAAPGAHPPHPDQAQQERPHPRHGLHHDGRPLTRHCHQHDSRRRARGEPLHVAEPAQAQVPQATARLVARQARHALARD
jgi:hypothetical protein